MPTATDTQKIAGLYSAFFNRAPDANGLASWEAQLAADEATIFDIAAGFAENPMFEETYGEMTDQEFVEAVYTNVLGGAGDTDGIAYWVEFLATEGNSRADMVAQFVSDSLEYDADAALEAGEITQEEYDAAVERQAFITNKAEVGIYFAQTLGEDSDVTSDNYLEDQAYLASIEVLANVDTSADSVAAAKAVIDAAAATENPAATILGEEPVEPSVPGEEFLLTAATDTDLGNTENDDTYLGYLSQNAFTGGVSNTLSSADRIDGGEGTDTLDVELVDEFVGATTDTTIDVQPRTSSVEVVEIEARELRAGGGSITLDAKNMTDIERIGSSFSDADLTIENLTTLTEDGDIRLTSDLTIVMEHTDNFNSDDDASDLTVLFDEDYLNTSSTTGGSTLLVRLVNAVSNVNNNNPIFGTESFTFMAGETEITVDISDIAADASLDYTTAYSQVVNAINAAAADAGFDTISASLQPLSATVFSIPVTVDGTDYDVGDSAGSYYPILITNTGSEELDQGSFEQAQVDTDTDINSSMTPAPAIETELPISINVELEKAGRDGEGGNLTIGGKDWQSSNDTDQDQNNGIEIFNISVVGDDSKPSNLGQIISTDGALTTVNIETADTSLDSFAALTVRGDDTDYDGLSVDTPFGGTLDTLNANAFLGNLQIGSSDTSRAIDIETFTATGGGDVIYWASIGEQGDLDSLGNLAYSATTGAGNDSINADIDGGAQVTVTTGAGNDTVVAAINGDTDSGSKDSKLFVNSASGNNTVTVTSSDALHEAEIELGGGADTVYGNSVNIDASTGAGDDAIYVENTGDKAEATAAVGASTVVTSTNATGTFTVGDNSELLYGRTVRVTLDLPEDSGTANTAAAFVEGLEATFDIEASNGHLTTERDLYEAAANAINEDDVLSKLATAEVDSNGNLVVTYLIDGVTDADSIVAIEVLGDWADLSTTEKSSIVSELQAKYEDSNIAATDVESEYDGVTSLGATVALTTSEGSDSTDSTDNTVNAGLGDDVIVLSSDLTSVDTLEFDAGGFGNDTVVHFDDVDLLDFSAWLDNVESTSGSSVSETRIDGTVAAVGAIIENSVVVTDMSTINDNDAGAASALNFDTMTDTQVLNELNGAGTEFVAGANDANLVGDELKAIIMIEDDANANAADDNEGFYKVYEVVYNDADGEFTSVQLVGSLDLGSDNAFDALTSAQIV